MGQRLWKLVEQSEFGNFELIQYLELHGAEIQSKPCLRVPLSAIRAALRNPADAELSDDDIEFLKAEIEDFGVDDDEETLVEIYDIY